MYIYQVLACGDIINNQSPICPRIHCMKNPNPVLMHFNPNACLIFRLTTTIIKMSRLYCITYTSVGSGLIMSSFPLQANINYRENE